MSDLLYVEKNKSGTMVIHKYNKTKSTCTEIFISAFPKLLVWVIAIGISGSKIHYYDDSYNMIHIMTHFEHFMDHTASPSPNESESDSCI